MFGIDNFSQPIVDYSNFDFSQLVSAVGFGGAVLLIGMVTIFSVLCIIWFCLVLFRIFFHDLPEKRANKNKNINLAAVTETVSEDTSPDGEIIAVIAAAIAMAESEKSGVKFRVVSFKRK